MVIAVSVVVFLTQFTLYPVQMSQWFYDLRFDTLKRRLQVHHNLRCAWSTHSNSLRGSTLAFQKPNKKWLNVLAEAIAPSEVTYENYLTILTVEYYFDEIGTCCYDLHSLAHYSLLYSSIVAHPRIASCLCQQPTPPSRRPSFSSPSSGTLLLLPSFQRKQRRFTDGRIARVQIFLQQRRLPSHHGPFGRRVRRYAHASQSSIDKWPTCTKAVTSHSKKG